MTTTENEEKKDRQKDPEILDIGKTGQALSLLATPKLAVALEPLRAHVMDALFQTIQAPQRADLRSEYGMRELVLTIERWNREARMYLQVLIVSAPQAANVLTDALALIPDAPDPRAIATQEEMKELRKMVSVLRANLAVEADGPAALTQAVLGLMRSEHGLRGQLAGVVNTTSLVGRNARLVELPKVPHGTGQLRWKEKTHIGIVQAGEWMAFSGPLARRLSLEHTASSQGQDHLIHVALLQISSTFGASTALNDLLEVDDGEEPAA